MPNDKINEYSEQLISLARDLDISPSDYQEAIRRYKTLGEYLNETEYEGAENGVIIYPQGSFELGTVVRPIKDSEEPGYDVDLVCQITIPKKSTSPEYIKNAIGYKLKESLRYKRMLREEGKRCWKLEYDKDNGIDFHMDVLPSVKESREKINQLKELTDFPNLVDTAIALTNKENGRTYTWSTSNPAGYSSWFKMINNTSLPIKTKQELYENNLKIFASVDDVPDQLVHTPLQRAIQILKRHRDVRFSGHEYEKIKPISMIITTLSAHCYENEDDVYSALKNIIFKLAGHSLLLEGSDFQGLRQFIRRETDGSWYIGNPVNAGENFADRWHEDDHIRAKAFFDWVELLEKDIHDGRIFEIGYNKADDSRKLGALAVITEQSKPHVEIKGKNKLWGKLS